LPEDDPPDSPAFPDICAAAGNAKHAEMQNAQNIITTTAGLFVRDGFIVQSEKSNLSQ